MAEPEDLYCFVARPARRARTVSAYLVERSSGPVVARIESLGQVRTIAPEVELRALGLRRRLWIAGRATPTRSGRHARVPVRPLPASMPEERIV
ncbi:MAG TPA: hypothetical protein VGS61_00755 [Acidimicrobiales bacterium]|nr:hypothetical protein [Acidimicrobiales bacterium]